MKRLALLLLTAIALFGADTARTLMDADEAFCRDFAARGVDGWMAWWADDLVAFPGSGPIIRTKAAATEYYRKVFPPDRKHDLRWKPEGGMISASADLGFTWGTWKSASGTGKYLTNWKKQKDGSWKIVADIGSPDTPPKQP